MQAADDAPVGVTSGAAGNRRRRPLVLIVSKGLAVGGAEKLLLAQARAWDRERFDYHVTYLTPRLDPLASAFEDLGVPVHRPQATSLARYVLGGGFARLLRRLRPDVVHAHLPVAGIATRLLAERRTVIVYSEHNMPSSYRLATRLANRATYARNDLAVCVSIAVFEAVEGYPHKRLLTVPNAVAVPEPATPAERVRTDLGVEPGQHLVVHVGMIRKGKGQENLVRAVAALLRKHRDVKVVSAGRADLPGELERLRQLTRDLGADGQLSFLGLRNDIADLFNAADLVVSPAEVEGLPVALLEAMMLGRPIVATAVGGVPALLPDGECALLVPPRDPERLAEAMDRVLSDPGLAARLGSSAREVALSKHSVQAAVDRLEAAYGELLDEVAVR